MPKPQKIKRYRHVYKSGTNPFKVILTVLGCGLLIFIGISIYQPVYDFIMRERDPNRPMPSQSQAELPVEPSQAQPEPEPEPEPPVVQAESLRMVYMPLATARDEAAREAFLNSADAGINTVLIDIKDKQGAVLFDTKNQDAIRWGAVDANPLDLTGLASELAGRGLHLAVRMSAFSDPLAAFGDRENAVRYQDSEWLWLDATEQAGGKPWLNPYADKAQQYITGLAVEAVEAGAALVILDDVQFADDSTSANASFGTASAGVTRQQVLKEFMEKITAETEAAGGRAGVYLPAASLADNAVTQVRYGGNPLDALGNTLIVGLLPYQFSADYSQDGLEIADPLENPKATVSAALAHVQGLLKDKDVAVIPLLQGGSETLGAITGAQVAEQVDAVQAAGLESYVLYQTLGQYLYQ